MLKTFMPKVDKERKRLSRVEMTILYIMKSF